MSPLRVHGAGTRSMGSGESLVHFAVQQLAKAATSGRVENLMLGCVCAELKIEGKGPGTEDGPRDIGQGRVSIPSSSVDRHLRQLRN